MAKTSFINVRVEEEDKNKAEEILNELGINTSTAIDMFLKQIILNDGLPFDVKKQTLDYQKYEAELALALHLPIKGPFPRWFSRIAALYAKGDIEYDVAVFAIGKAMGK